jgi:CubicO group peptidase (beta-lactamase class C family)
VAATATGADPRLRRATLEQLLTMTAGLPADPTDGSPPNLVHAGDWVRFVLSQCQVDKRPDHPSTSADEGEQARRDRNLSSGGPCW